MMNLLEVS